MSADGSAVCRIRRTGGPAPGREPPTKLAADALAALCAAVLTPACAAPEPQGVLAEFRDRCAEMADALNLAPGPNTERYVRSRTNVIGQIIK